MKNNLFAIIGFLILSGLGVWFMYQDKLVQPITLLANMRETEARITAMNERVYSRSRENAGYEVEYEITIDGATFPGKSMVDSRPSGRFMVWYMPANPSYNNAEMRGHAIIDLVIFAIPATVFTICLLVLVVPLVLRRRDAAARR